MSSPIRTIYAKPDPKRSIKHVTGGHTADSQSFVVVMVILSALTCVQYQVIMIDVSRASYLRYERKEGVAVLSLSYFLMK